MTTKDWLTKNLPEINDNQIKMLTQYIEDREREAAGGDLDYCDENGCLRKIFKPHVYCSKHVDATSDPLQNLQTTPVTQQTTKEREE